MIAPGDFIGPYRVLAEISRLASSATYLVEHPAQGPAAPAFLTIWPEIHLRSSEEERAFTEACQKLKEGQASAFPLLASGVENEAPYILLSDQQAARQRIALIDQELLGTESSAAAALFLLAWQAWQETPQPQPQETPKPKPRTFPLPAWLTPSRIMGTRRGRTWAGALAAFLIVSVVIAVLYIVVPVSAAALTLLPKSKHVQQSLSVIVSTQTNQSGDIHGQLIAYTTPAQTQTAQATGTIHQDATAASGNVVISQISLNNSGGSADIGSSTIDSNSGVSITLESFTAPDGGTVTVPAQAAPGSGGNIPAYDIDFPVVLCNAFDFLCNNPIGYAYAQNPDPFTGGSDASDQPVVTQSDIDSLTGALTSQLTPSAQAGLTQLLAQQMQPGEVTALPTPQCTPAIQADHKANDVAPTVTASGTVTCYQIAYAQQDFLPGVIHAQQQLVDAAYGQGYGLVGAMLAASPVFQSTDATQGTAILLVKANSIWVYQVDDALKAQVAQQSVGKTQSDARSLLLHLHAGIQDVTFALQGFGSKLPMDAHAIRVAVKAVAGLRA